MSIYDKKAKLTRLEKKIKKLEKDYSKAKKEYINEEARERKSRRGK